MSRAPIGLREGDRLIRDGQEWIIGPVVPTYAEPDDAGVCPMCGGEGRIYDVTAAIEAAQERGTVLLPLRAYTAGETDR